MQDLFTTAPPRGGFQSPPRARRHAGIPVPPYDQELPQSYWKSLHTPRRRKKKGIPIWFIALSSFSLVATCAYTLGVVSQRQKEPSDTVRAAPTPWPTPETHYVPPAIAHVERAALVLPPGSGLDAVSWIPGYQYRVTMPDGRILLVNFKGWVNHACNLPNFHGAPANNAMYIETATGHGWIYTVQIYGGAPCWIDP